MGPADRDGMYGEPGNDKLVEVVEKDVTEGMRRSVQTVVDGNQLAAVPDRVDGFDRQWPGDGGRHTQIGIAVENGSDGVRDGQPG